MKTITVYELLEMVKDGKELPKKVKVLDVIYEFDDHYGDYFNKSLDRYLFVYMTSEEEWKLSYFLNAQVEILEEEKKIPEKLPLIANTEVNYPDDEFIERILNLFYELNNKNRLKINEIIDYFEYLKNKGDE